MKCTYIGKLYAYFVSEYFYQVGDFEILKMVAHLITILIPPIFELHVRFPDYVLLIFNSNFIAINYATLDGMVKYTIKNLNYQYTNFSNEKKIFYFYMLLHKIDLCLMLTQANYTCIQ